MIIYFKKPDDWPTACIHYWGTLPDNLESQWPGMPMTKTTDEWHCFTLKGQSAANFIFNNGAHQQTRNLFSAHKSVWYVDDDLWDISPDHFKYCTFPKGRSKAIVMSYDDGHIRDEKLVDIFNAYGIKGSFHLNSGLMHLADKVPARRVTTLYQGHEVSVHSKTHPFLDNLDADQLYEEVMEDKITLENLTGYRIDGIAYPFGPYSGLLLDLLKKWEFVYGRVVDPPTNDYRLPANALTWRPCCHQSAAWEPAQRFVAHTPSGISLLLIWGHSWELDGGQYGNDWEHIDALCKLLGRRDDIWYATFAEVAGYVAALRALIFSPDQNSVYNPSAVSIWIKKNGLPVELFPDNTLVL